MCRSEADSASIALPMVVKGRAQRGRRAEEIVVAGQPYPFALSGATCDDQSGLNIKGHLPQALATFVPVIPKWVGCDDSSQQKSHILQTASFPCRTESLWFSCLSTIPVLIKFYTHRSGGSLHDSCREAHNRVARHSCCSVSAIGE